MGVSCIALVANAMIFFGLAIHPFATYPLSLRLIRHFMRRPVQPGSRQAPSFEEGKPRYSICMCAYNEDAVIREKMLNLLALTKRLGQAEILVFIDGSTDGTSRVLEEFHDRVMIIDSAERVGKSAGMNTLLSHARAPIVIFTDANVMIEPDSISRLARYFEDPAVGCVCGHLTYVNPAASATAEAGTRYWALEERIKQLESETGSVMGADGSLFAIRRQLFHQIPPDIIDDMFTSLNILCNGSRVVRAHDVHALESQAVSAGDEFRRKIRIGCQAFNVHRMLWPRLRRLPPVELYKYLSHRFLKWMAGFSFLIGAIFSSAALFICFGLQVTLGLALAASALLAVLATLSPRKLRVAIDSGIAVIGTSIGVIRSLQGERFQTWTPPASSRPQST